MTLKEALKRIEALEREVAELKARPPTQFHYYYQPLPQPLPSYPPSYPIWFGSSTIGAVGSCT